MPALGGTSLSQLLLVALLISLAQTANATCAKLTTPSPHCPDVDYETTIEDTASIEVDIVESVNYISRQGFDKADASCMLSFRKALCFQKFIRCDPVTGNIPKVCDSVRQDVLSLCSKMEGFHDTAPLEARFDKSRYENTPDCYPAKIPVSDKPVVEKEEKASAPVEKALPVVTVTVTAPASEPTEDSEPAKKEESEPAKKEDTEQVKKEDTEQVQKEDAEQVKKEESESAKKEDTKPAIKEDIEQVKKKDSEPEDTEPAKKEDTEPPKRVSTKKAKLNLDSAPGEPEPTTTQKACTNSDIEVSYGTCKVDGTRDMTFAIKKDVNCADLWALAGRSDPVACACTKETLASFLTTCSEKSTQNRLWYHGNLLLPVTSEAATAEKPWPCDRRAELPSMEPDVDCASTKDKVPERPNETVFGKNSIEIAWGSNPSNNIRTGLQKVECARPSLNSPTTANEPVDCSSDLPVKVDTGFTGWTMKERVAHSDAPPPGVLSFLELDITPSADVTSPFLLFTYSVNSAPYLSGLRFLLDHRIAMPLTSNLTELKSYAVALDPGKVHVARWEYLTGPEGWEDIDKATEEGYRAILQNVYITNTAPITGADKPVVENQGDSGVPLLPVAGILLLSGVAVGGVAFLSRRKRRRKDLGGFVGVEYKANGDREFALLRGKDEGDENMELESFDVFGDSDHEFDMEDDVSTHSSKANGRLNTRNPGPGTPYLDVDSDEEKLLVGAGVGTG